MEYTWIVWERIVSERSSPGRDSQSRVQELCTMFTNTEFLSCIYRALGTKIGRRVQIDQRLVLFNRNVAEKNVLGDWNPCPMGSIYGIFTDIYHKKQSTIHVGKYTSPMDGMGWGSWYNIITGFRHLQYL